MSTENYHIRSQWTFLLVIAFAVTLSAASKYGDDQVLEFYCTQVEASSRARNPFAPGVKAAATAHSFYKRVASNGHITSVDTAVIRYWFTGGLLDSQVVASTTWDGMPQITFESPQLFSGDYLFNFFPNDPGGEMLSIAFDTPDDSTATPVGLAVIDRDKYVLQRLYLHYPRLDGYKRLSRGFRFAESGGYLFPDSIWEVGAKEGVLTTEHYRLESRIDSITIGR